MRPGLLLLLLLGACSPPRPAPATAAPAGTPADTHGPRPRAALQMAPAPAVCVPHTDPEGWFALGDPALPPRSVLRASPSTVALGFDETGAPMAAALGEGGALVVATVREGALRLEHPSRQDKGNLIKLALGAEPEGAVVAATTDLGKLVVLRRRSGAWQDRAVAVFCVGKRWDAEFGALSEWPELTVDGAGRVWSACLVRSFGGTGSGRTGVFPSNPPVRETRLRLGRLEGTRWLEVGAGSVLPSTAQGVVLATSPEGDVLVRIGSSDQKTFWSGVVPLREAGRGARTGPLSLVATSGSGAWFGGQGTGWLQFAEAQTCTGAAPCRLTATDATLALAGSPLAVARRGEVWLAAWASGTGLVSLSQYDRTLGLRPLIASAAGGVSATPGLSVDPAIAVDACGQPTVFWSEDGKRMGRTFADGQWRTLPSIPGPGPHGLLVGAGGEVYVGAWEPRDGAWQYTVSRIMAGAVTPLPPLVLRASEWTVVDAGRTRLSFDGALHAAFPRRDNALAGARRAGYVLRGAVWEEEPVPANLIEAPAMPWTTSATADQSALAIDERGRRIVVWSKGDTLGVAQWKGSSWTPLPGGDVTSVAVQGAPAIAAEGGRVCVAWGAPSGNGSDIFVRCHRGEP